MPSNKDEQALADQLVEAVVRKIISEGPCALVKKEFKTMAVNKKYIVTITPATKENDNV